MDKSSDHLDLLAGISHEIRNPLQAIIGISSLINMENSEEEQKELIATLKLSSEYLLEITNNILDFTKLESKKVYYDFYPVDLRKEVPRSLYGQKTIAKSKGLNLSIEIDDNVPSSILIDKVKFLQVLINLVSNAVKFTREGSVKVLIKAVMTTAKQVTLKCLVSDTGMGIPHEKRETIFKPFRQGSGDINLEYGGTGLGLTISNRLITAMGGELRLKSELQKGTEFSFILTFDLPEETEPKEENQKIIPDQLSKNLKVLIVDDNKINLMIAQKHFFNWGIECYLARDGQEALEKVQEQDFNMVFMDLRMPKLDGFEATRSIRNLNDAKYLGLPIIALTGSNGISHEEQLKSTGFTDFLIKPYKPQDLLEKIYAFG